MSKIKKIIFLVIVILLISATTVSYARLVDLEYPPNSTGYTDFTDEEADRQAQEQANNSNTSEDYVGKSSNNNLKTLQIENATIEPEFNSLTLDYSVTLNNSESKSINIIAEPEDEGAVVEGAGTIELADGINKLQIVVRAENGNVKMYNLTINLPFKQSNLRLSLLEVNGIHIDGGEDTKERLSPAFQNDIFEYTLTVPYKINGLSIKAEAEENTYVSISGGDPLEVGKNTVLIEVRDSNDENNKTTYVINVERRAELSFNIILVIVFVILAIVVIIAILIKNKKHKRKGKH